MGKMVEMAFKKRGGKWGQEERENEENVIKLWTKQERRGKNQDKFNLKGNKEESTPGLNYNIYCMQIYNK